MLRESFGANGMKTPASDYWVFPLPKNNNADMLVEKYLSDYEEHALTMNEREDDAERTVL